MIAEQKTAQLRVKKNCIIAEGGGGTIFYATPTRARLLIDGGGAELVNVGPAVRPVVGPSETPTAGPSEFKEPVEKKSVSQDVQAGPLTGSASSTESGTAPLSSSSAAALVSAERKPGLFRRRGRPPKSA